MDKIRTDEVTDIINDLRSVIEHKDLYSAEISTRAHVALKMLLDLEKEVLHAEYKADCKGEEGS
jgi:hypothetical protein